MIELNKKSTIVEVKNNQKSSEKSEQNTVQKNNLVPLQGLRLLMQKYIK